MSDGSTPSCGDWNLADIAAGLQAARSDWRAAHRGEIDHAQVGFPSRSKLEATVADLAGALFPLRLGPPSLRLDGEEHYVLATLDRTLRQLREQVALELSYPGANPASRTAGEIVGAFAERLPSIRRLLDSDVEAAQAGDPAACSVDEVLLCYPGVQALIHHRIAHSLNRLGAPLVARIVAEIAHGATGIDIHPGAPIGASFFIDHGTGVVIGETSVIGERVRLYQAVTLGACSFPVDGDGVLAKRLARHPIVGVDVVIYAGATILGGVTVGAGAVIGGNVWLTEDVPAGSIIHQAFAERERNACSVPTGHVVAEASDAADRKEES